MSNNLCETGNKQSPIDIIKKNTQRCATLCDLFFYYRPSKCVVKNINNDDIVLDYDVGSNISYNNTVNSKIFGSNVYGEGIYCPINNLNDDLTIYIGLKEQLLV